MTWWTVLLFCILWVHARDPAYDQLLDYANNHNKSSNIETSYGVPVPDITDSLTVGPRGPILLQDIVFLDTMAHFDRERIPERVVHARGSGAFGYFEVTKNITQYCKAKVFESIGKRTRIAVRFSLATGERGTPETVRDSRGFAIKFYTEDGIWDIVGYNKPVFFIREPLLFPMLVHVFSRNPVTNIKQDSNMIWDFVSQVPQTTRDLLWYFSDAGIPDGYRYMPGFGQHAFKMVNGENEAVYVKFHFLSDQGIRNLSPEKAANLAGTNPDYATHDLYNAIAEEKFPSWTMKIQVMTFEQAETFRWNPFDVTKEWPLDEYHLIEVGKIVLNENPTNYFADVEQIAFSPAHMVPGIEPSPDKMLQGRLFAYSDTQRYRLGINHLQLPVNCPFHGGKITNYLRDGKSAIYNQGGAPNYFPNSFGGPINVPNAAISKFNLTGDVQRYNSSLEDNFTQSMMFWNSLTTIGQEHVVENIANSLKNAAPFLQNRSVQMFSNVNVTLARKLQERLAALA